MIKYVLKRILQLIPMLLVLSLIVFLMVRMIPGDPVKNMLGIDVPQECRFVKHIGRQTQKEKAKQGVS